MQQTILEARDATVWNGETRALSGLTLTLREGESTAILGPNGAGKTTLLRLITGELRAERPPGGGPAPVCLFGVDSWDIWSLRRRLGLITNDLERAYFSAAPGALARDAVRSGFFSSIGLYQDTTAAMDERVDEIATFLGIGALMPRQLATLSSGEIRKCLIARALVHDPAVLVLDEPTTGLDLKARADFLAMLERLTDAGKTLLLITHHVEEIIPPITRVLLLRHGSIIADGAKQDTLTDEKLSALFGTPVTVTRDGERYTARLG
jgi:iron complex transport system ATP-binding protein